jgi:Flp pilus assembly protein TadD
VEGEQAMRELEERYDGALSTFASGDRTRAEALVRDVLDRYRYHAGALVLAGTLAALRGNFALASTHFALAVRESPGDADAHFNLAQSLEREGRSKEAASAYRRVLALAPEHPHARAGLARLEAIGRT